MYRFVRIWNLAMHLAACVRTCLFSAKYTTFFLTKCMTCCSLLGNCFFRRQAAYPRYNFFLAKRYKLRVSHGVCKNPLDFGYPAFTTIWTGWTWMLQSKTWIGDRLDHVRMDTSWWWGQLHPPPLLREGIAPASEPSPNGPSQFGPTGRFFFFSI
jgi:hypothetical protein